MIKINEKTAPEINDFLNSNVAANGGDWDILRHANNAERRIKRNETPVDELVGLEFYARETISKANNPVSKTLVELVLVRQQEGWRLNGCTRFLYRENGGQNILGIQKTISLDCLTHLNCENQSI